MNCYKLYKTLLNLYLSFHNCSFMKIVNCLYRNCFSARKYANCLFKIPFFIQGCNLFIDINCRVGVCFSDNRYFLSAYDFSFDWLYNIKGRIKNGCSVLKGYVKNKQNKNSCKNSKSPIEFNFFDRNNYDI